MQGQASSVKSVNYWDKQIVLCGRFLGLQVEKIHEFSLRDFSTKKGTLKKRQHIKTDSAAI